METRKKIGFFLGPTLFLLAYFSPLLPQNPRAHSLLSVFLGNRMYSYSGYRSLDSRLSHDSPYLLGRRGLCSICQSDHHAFFRKLCFGTGHVCAWPGSKAGVFCPLG